MHSRKHVVLALGLAGFAIAGSAPTRAIAEVVAVVSAQSPVTALDADAMVAIFLGKSNRFPDGAVAIPIDQAEGSPLRNEFYARFAGKSPAQIKAHWSKIIFTGRGRPPREVATGSDAKRLLAESPNAIAYIDREDIDDRVRAIELR